VSWDGDAYQARFDALAGRGVDVHGEAAFVLSLEPPAGSVLDAGCGTGRVACELARRGVAVVGVDVDASMLTVARRAGAAVEWIEHDLATLELGRTFDVVLMAGNVPLFTAAGTEGALVAGVARHVNPTGQLVAGFQLERGFGLDDYDAHCAAAGLTMVSRYATWDRDRFVDGGDYAVSVHRHR
jgi:2-polyprenyl-3-methyl-5-hydroxy-6-metoxy-1,4-benzoquinol methylase